MEDLHSFYYTSINEIKNVLLKKRRSAHCHYQLITNRNLNDVNRINKYLEQFNVFTLIPNWRTIELHEAKKILEFVLSRHLAYNNLIMQFHEVKDLSRKFLSIFDEGRYYTNGVFNYDGKNIVQLNEFSSITNSTFDSGIIAIDNEKIGMIWVEDED